MTVLTVSATTGFMSRLERWNRQLETGVDVVKAVNYRN